MSQSINVPGFSQNNLLPGVFAAIDASLANTGQVPQRTLMFGQMLSSGTAAANVAVASAGVGDAQTAFGLGSELAISVERYRALDPTGQLVCVPLADNGTGAAATATATITGPSTAVSVIPLYCDGNPVPIPVNVGDTATTVATNMAATVNGFTTAGGNPLPYTAAAVAGVVTFTWRHKSALGNQSTLSLSYLGTAGGQGQPGTSNAPGITIVLTAFTGGTLNPVLTTALANLPSEAFDFICCPFNDTTSLSALGAFLNEAAGRWNWSVQLFGVVFTGFNGTFSARGSFAIAQNLFTETVTGLFGGLSPDWHFAADYCATSAVSIRSDPTIPIGGLTQGAPLNVVGPPLASRDTAAERQTLLADGFTTCKTSANGSVFIDRAVTTFTANASGGPNNAFQNLNVPFQLMAYIRAVETLIGSQFNQVKLVADGSRTPPGSSMVTSQTILFSVIAQYETIATTGLPGAPVGLVQNPKMFAAAASAENAGGGIVKMRLPVQLGNQLIAVAMDIQFTQP